MTNDAARRLVERMKSDVDLFFRIALIEDREERDAALHKEGCDCDWDEFLAVFNQPSGAK